MLISEFIKSLRGCRHKHVPVTSNGCYCPDCGQYVVIKWYLVRCSCCGVKRVAFLDFNDNVKAVDNFCPNCGSTATYVEELCKINFVDINFSVHKKEIIIPYSVNSRTQVWAEQNQNKPQELLEMRQNLSR